MQQPFVHFLIDAYLLSIETQVDSHLQNVLSLLYDQENPEIASVKLSIAVYIRNFMRQTIA